MKKSFFIIVLAVIFSTVFSTGAHQTGSYKIGSTIENDDRKATFNSAKISESLIELNFTTRIPFIRYQDRFFLKFPCREQRGN